MPTADAVKVIDDPCGALWLTGWLVTTGENWTSLTLAMPEWEKWKSTTWWDGPVPLPVTSMNVSVKEEMRERAKAGAAIGPGLTVTKLRWTAGSPNEPGVMNPVPPGPKEGEGAKCPTSPAWRRLWAPPARVTGDPAGSGYCRIRAPRICGSHPSLLKVCWPFERRPRVEQPAVAYRVKRAEVVHALTALIGPQEHIVVER